MESLKPVLFGLVLGWFWMHSSTQKVCRVRHLQTIFVFAFLIGPTVSGLQAQGLSARITVDSLSPATLRIEAEWPLTDTWSFRNNYVGIVGLGERVVNFQVTDVQGKSVSVRKLAPGEFRASKKASRFNYQIRVSEPSRLVEMSHISWLNREYGLLMLADLLPQLGIQGRNPQRAVIEFDLPVGWKVVSSLQPDSGGQYLASAPDDAVFFVGRSLREKSKRMNSMEFTFVTTGEWAFTENDATRVARKVIAEHSKVTRFRLPGRSVLMLVPFSSSVGPERWSAETRGSNVVLLIGRHAEREPLLAKLGVVLTHELFHLWVPKALALESDYDWFFEGFTLYQALLTALHLRFISFSDYLDTLARVYDSYRSSPDHDKLSLIEASERRWVASSSLVYDKGMLVAFLYDLMVRRASNGKASVADVYRELFQLSRAPGGNANELIMSILNRQGGMDQFAQRYVLSVGRIELQALLASYGLKIETIGLRTRLTVAKELTPKERRLLGKLGYKG